MFNKMQFNNPIESVHLWFFFLSIVSPLVHMIMIWKGAGPCEEVVTGEAATHWMRGRERDMSQNNAKKEATVQIWYNNIKHKADTIKPCFLV